MTLLMIVAVTICIYAEKRPEPATQNRQTDVAFLIPAGDSEETVFCWSEDAEHAFVFLPSYVEMKDVSVVLRTGIDAAIGDVTLADGMDCGSFHLNTDYQMRMQDQNPISLRFVRSGNLPAMFIHTISGTEETIHTQRNVWEYTKLCLADAEGKTDYQGDLDEISGRGSGSWYYEKKSYNIKLNQPSDLLGMGAGKRWILLANALDESQMRNKLVYDFARGIESYAGFAPDCEYVDLYLNGTYVGLYLLTEKIEIAKNRVAADPNAILFEVDAISRFDRMNLPFILDWGIAAGIKSPKSSSEQDRDKLMNQLFLFQDTLQSESGGTDALQYIDLESWTRRYLIDEIFENFDGGCHSQFFYWDPREGKDNRIFAGPCWDYDNCADSWSEAKQNPRCFPMLRIWKNDSEHTPWYGTLMKQSAFRNRVMELYRTELSAKLHRLLQVDIAEETAFIQTALNLNALRWNLADPADAIRHFHDFMEERIDFLDSAWIDGVEYRTVTAKSVGDYRFYCVQPGQVCEDIPTPEELGMEKETIWIREDNGETFDRKMPIWEDLTIIAVRGDGQVKSADN